jgi:Ni,Fe-hydrogenase maturation factor
MMFYPINKNKMELLIGTKKGTIGVVTSKKYFCAIKYKAHEMRINCLVMLKKEKQKIFVSSS